MTQTISAQTTTTWPTNQFGTSWRRAFVYFHRPDEDTVEEAIEIVGLSRVTMGPTDYEVIVDTGSGGWLHIDEYAKNLRPEQGSRLIENPGSPVVTVAQIELDHPGDVSFDMFGCMRIDIMDEATYDALVQAFQDRAQYMVGMPVIEF